MKETVRKNPGAGKQKKPVRRNKSTDAGASGDGALGLETNLYICKRFLESGSVERAIQEITDYIRDLFDLVLLDLLDAGAISFLKKPYKLSDMTAILQNAQGGIGSASAKGE